jgi:diaminopimelate epimerase
MIPPAAAIPFRKMHGLGNDFVVIDARVTSYRFSPAMLARIADRRFGIGCDQLIVLEPSTKADAFMRIFNPDASEVAVSGHCLRRKRM